MSTNKKHEINTVQYAKTKIVKACSAVLCAPLNVFFYSTSDLYNHQCSLEYIYLHTQDLVGRHTCEKMRINRTKRICNCRSDFRTRVQSSTGEAGGEVRGDRVEEGGGRSEEDEEVEERQYPGRSCP